MKVKLISVNTSHRQGKKKIELEKAMKMSYIIKTDFSTKFGMCDNVWVKWTNNAMRKIKQMNLMRVFAQFSSVNLFQKSDK